MKAYPTLTIVLATLGAPSVILAQAAAAPGRAAGAPAAPVAPAATKPATATAAPAGAAPAAADTGVQSAAETVTLAPAPAPAAVGESGSANPASEAGQIGSGTTVSAGAGTVSAPSGSVAGRVRQGGAVAEALPNRPPRRVKTRYPLSVQLDIMPLWQSSNGFDLFSAKDVSTRVGLSASYDLVELAPKTPLAVELGWSSESRSGKGLFSGFDAEFRSHNFHGGVKARHQLWRFLAPYASLAAGASWMETNFAVTGGTGIHEFETEKWVAFGMLGVGLAAMLPLENVLMPGISAEAGYLVSGSMPLRLDPNTQGQSLATSGATLGTLERSGPYLRFGVFCRF